MDEELKVPFVGLRPFFEEEASIFFGREQEVDTLLGKMQLDRFAALAGFPSSGKTSLLRAGFMPKIKELNRSSDEKWDCVFLTSQGNPFNELSRRLVAVLQDADKVDTTKTLDIEMALRSGASGLEVLLKDEDWETGNHLVIIIDSFEELLNERSLMNQGEYKEDTRAFLKLLMHSVKQNNFSIHALVAFRTGFIEKSSLLPGLSDLIVQNQVLLSPMSEDQIKRAVQLPLLPLGIELSEGLEGSLLSDLSGSSFMLSRLQHVMYRIAELWLGEENIEGRKVDLQEYNKVGTAKLSVAHQLEEIFTGLSAEQQKLMADFFKAVVENERDSSIFTPPTRSELLLRTGASNEELNQIIQILAGPGACLIKASQSDDVFDKLSSFNDPYWEGATEETLSIGSRGRLSLSTDLILEQWERLDSWIREEEEDAKILSRLVKAHRLYIKGERGLFKNPELEIALAWAERIGRNEEWGKRYTDNFREALDFLDESQRDFEEKRRKKERIQKNKVRAARIAAVFVGLIALIPLGFGFYALREKKRLEKNEEHILEIMAQSEEARRNALKAEGKALLEKKKAEFETQVAKESLKELEKARMAISGLVEEEKKARKIAQDNEYKARNAIASALRATKVALEAKALTDTFRFINQSRVNTLEVLQQEKLDYEKFRAPMLTAFRLNSEYSDGKIYPEMYAALRKMVHASQSITLNYNDDSKPVLSIDVNSENGYVATGDELGRIFLYKPVAKGLQLFDRVKIKGEVRVVHFEERENFLIAGSHRGDLFIVDLNAPQRVLAPFFQFGKKEKIKSIHSYWERGAMCLAVLTDRELVNLKFEGNKWMKEGSVPVVKEGQVEFFPDSPQEFLLSEGNQLIKMSVKSGFFSRESEYKLTVPVSRMSLNLLEGMVLAGSKTGEVVLYDLNSGFEQPLQKHLSAITGLGVSIPERGVKAVVSSSLDNQLVITYMKEGGVLNAIRLNSGQGWIYGLRFSPDNRLIYTVGQKNDLKIWFAHAKDMVSYIRSHQN